MAIRKGDLELCKTLIQAGTSVNQMLDGCAGRMPVLGAFFRGQKDIASYLIGKGASTLGRLCNKIAFGDSAVVVFLLYILLGIRNL